MIKILLFLILMIANQFSAQTYNFDYKVHVLERNIKNNEKITEEDLHISSADYKIKLMSQDNAKFAYFINYKNFNTYRFSTSTDVFGNKILKYKDSLILPTEIKESNITRIKVAELSKYKLLVKIFSEENSKKSYLYLTIEIEPFEVNYLNLLTMVRPKNERELINENIQNEITKLYGNQNFILKSCLSDNKNGQKSQTIFSDPKKESLEVKLPE
ncbi:hypothetical protein [Halpernia frigidisoli]|uniref:Uncharacterized protein n=1 Tax=Halpernia frigidisoli TaxID=1125876 RepID=A0A1I3DYX0_9FLAO|nr:hypothetical protein [Halpernia frigidisoli]SFH91778.1 hypothetical protein SAMN05443292_0774 [Halpernia frigidisoli]